MNEATQPATAEAPTPQRRTTDAGSRRGRRRALLALLAVTAVVLVGVFIILYWTTIRSEEEFLHGRFGREWEDYVAGTSRFFPFKLGRLRQAFVPGWNVQQWMQNRGWGVYLGIVVLLGMLWVYRVYLR